ncbi:nucleolar protein 16-like [Daphnia pulex]|uniref:nucleolar protein 16-like n=1 Tax=Daphnia pulex TaxID=6669 RepID=UPI001EE00C3E|nr:nucleolar protein 16-like [Daphnia pulex]
MVSNKKSRGRKKFQYHVDKKKVAKKAKKVPNINCKAIKNSWRGDKSASTNLRSMGLVYDANRSLPVSTKTPLERVPKEPTAVVKELEKEMNAPRTGTMRMPKEKVKWIEYLLGKHGEDYEAMAMDKNNHYQETAAQIRQKIKQFKKRPAYLVKFMKACGKLPPSEEAVKE